MFLCLIFLLNLWGQERFVQSVGTLKGFNLLSEEPGEQKKCAEKDSSCMRCGSFPFLFFGKSIFPSHKDPKDVIQGGTKEPLTLEGQIGKGLFRNLVLRPTVKPEDSLKNHGRDRELQKQWSRIQGGITNIFETLD